MLFKCIFLTGGVVSSLGKGLTAASLALLLERQGLKVAMLKLDPYLNIDPGTMNPFEHGEVYVTDDGVETDLDLGHYHRFSSAKLSKYSTATSGQIYARVIKKERDGFYLGSTVQVVPHITNEIIQVILECAQDSQPDVIVVEIGGTVGDIESLPFLEAIRQFRYEHPNDCLNIHITYVPYLKAAGEVKTKPTQHSVQCLRSIGIIPDAVICRSETPLGDDIKKKISLFCHVPCEAVFNIIDLKHSIYEMPLVLAKENISSFIAKKLNLSTQVADLNDWEELVARFQSPMKNKVRIGLVGKYIQHKDAYKSIFEAITHAGLSLHCDVDILPIDSEDPNLSTALEQCDGCLVPGGFGSRGWEGKITAAQFCRETQLPYFGICLGMQVMVVEYARHVLRLPTANSTEMDPDTPFPLVWTMEGQDSLVATGGTMRLGTYVCELDPDSKVFQAYKQEKISERHRHRYEVNSNYLEDLRKHGLCIVGTSPNRDLCEIVEIKDHPWMIGVQFHPEFLSKLIAPHPLFIKFIEAALEHSRKRAYV
ncbi:CTP synthase [Chlamydia ibidis]|uniref:CTP synthase n=2 Tax=Chlamydia ibidis TaxID=1405396 RepID=S7KLL2_9CHLA|nr:CTP synthase [Chlamydia ibidis]EPP35315.1 CTP synthase [Chlamydia ibidis]EQM62811.1 CTP synthase [Chlamydia ibidis 10-1398/6]